MTGILFHLESRLLHISNHIVILMRQETGRHGSRESRPKGQNKTPIGESVLMCPARHLDISKGLGVAENRLNP